MYEIIYIPKMVAMDICVVSSIISSTMYSLPIHVLIRDTLLTRRIPLSRNMSK